MRATSKPGEKSVISGLLNKFKPVNTKKEASVEQKQPETLKEEREVLAEKGKRIAQDDGLTVRAYNTSAPGNVAYQPSRMRDDRDQIINKAAALVKSAIEDKIGKGGIEVDLVNDGFKVSASVASVHHDEDNIIQKARAVFRVSMQTPQPGKKRVAFASVAFDMSKDTHERYSIAQHLVPFDDQETRVPLEARKLAAFINTGEVEVKRTAKRQKDTAENQHEQDRKLVFRDFRGVAAKYTPLPVKSVENAVFELRKAGFEIQPRKLDATHGEENVRGAVYEVIVSSAQLPVLDKLLRNAGEFTEISRKPKNDETSNTNKGEVFKNEEQIDDPTKFPGRSSEKNEPTYKKTDPENMAKDSEGHAYDQDQIDNNKKWPGRSTEKNHEGLPAKPENKPHGDEKANKRGPNPNMPGPGEAESVKDWPFRTLETGTDWGIGEMLRYENYRKTRPVQLKDIKKEAQGYSPLGANAMDMPLGSEAQAEVTPDFGGGNDELGGLIGDDSTGIMSDGEKVVLVTTRDNLIDLAGGVNSGNAAPAPAPTPAAPMTPATPPMGGGSTTPENRGLPGSTASKKKAEAESEDEEKDDEKEEIKEIKTAGGEAVPMPEGNSKFQKTAPSIKNNGDKMDGMDHGKSESEGKTPKVKPTEEADKYKVALKLAFVESRPAFAAAQRIAVLAAEYLNKGKVLNQEQFAEATKIASRMVAKSKGDTKNPYFVTTAFLKNDKLVLAQEIYKKIMVNDALKADAAVGGSGGVVPNPEPPKNPNNSPDDMTGLNNGKSDAGDSMTGFKSSDEPEAKKNEIGGINKNPDDPNMKKSPRGPEDGMSHGKSSGGEAAVKPSSEYKKSNPTKHMTQASYQGENPVKPLTNKFKDFREELLNHLSKQGGAKVPHRVFASVRNAITKDYEQEYTKLMHQFSKHEINDVTVSERKAQLEKIKLARIDVTRTARTAFARVVGARKATAAEGKPSAHFKVPDVKSDYNHQDDQWWDRALEKGGDKPKGGLPQMGLKEDEDKAYDEKLYDDDQNFVGRTREKSGGVAAKPLHSLRADEGKAQDNEKLYDDANDWVGRSAEKAGWDAPTSNSYMLKTEKKAQLEAVVNHVRSKKEGEYKKEALTPELMRGVLRAGGLAVNDKKIVEVKGGLYTYGTKNVDVISEVIDLHHRGLDDFHISFAMSKKHPDTLLNVPDILEGYKLARKGGPQANFKVPAGKAGEVKARIAKALKTAKNVDDRTVEKLLKFTNNDSPLEASPSGSVYMSMKDPGVIKDILSVYGKLEDYEVEYYICGKYGQKFSRWDIEDVIRAYKAMNKKGIASAQKKPTELIVEYDSGKGDFDDQISKIVGTAMTGSGTDLGTGVRDLSFDVKGIGVADIIEDLNHAAIPITRISTGGEDGESGEVFTKAFRKKKAAESKQYNETSYEKEKNDDIASDMPEQKSWQAGDISEADEELGRSDQEGELKDWQKPQPTVSSEEADDQPSYNKKDGQLSETVLPKESRDLGIEQVKSPVTHVGQPEKNNDVSFAPNDTVYDTTGRFGKATPASPYSAEHITEKIVLGVGKEFQSVQEAFDGAVSGNRFGVLSPAQIHQVSEALKAFGFSVKKPAASKKRTPTEE